jgi:phospholipase D1/2
LAARRAAAAETVLPVLQPGRNAWRVAPAGRAAVLADAAYYGALRAAMLNARRSIHVIAWDLDSRTPLLGESGVAEDGLPETLGEFVTAVVRRRPEVQVRLLLWDYSLLYAFERELMPIRALGWNTPPQVELCLDDTIPIGASHHQKLVVIDDSLAFSGGLDLSIRRWDRSDHPIAHPRRVDPSGAPYPPFHDVQMMVDGAAAGALAELVRQRWARAACEPVGPVQPLGDPWPHAVAPDFRDVAIGISRTQPRCDEAEEVREIEALFLDMARAAERSLYIENQFPVSAKMAAAIAARVAERPDLEVVIVAPKTLNNWVEQQVMANARIRFIEMLRDAGCGDRVRLLYPRVSDGDGKHAAVMVHSKVMIVDDRMLRVGSANLCNRSMGVDTECDLTIEAAGPVAARQITHVQARLIAEHCGASTEEVAALLRRGSLLATIAALAGRKHELAPIDLADLAPGAVSGLEELGDPERPHAVDEYLAAVAHEPVRPAGLSPGVAVAIAVLLVAVLVLAWRYTPLAMLARPELLATWLEELSTEPWAIVAALGAFLIGGLVAFPVTVLIAGTAAAFGTFVGLGVASVGALASALLTYTIGRVAGAGPLSRLLGSRVARISETIAAHGIPAITAIRLLPIAPFTLINLVAGAARIPVGDYIAGTALGLAPGLLLMSALGRQVFEVLRDPSGDKLLLFGLLVLVWLLLACLLQAVVKRYRRRRA